MKGFCRKGHLIDGNNSYISPSTGIARCLRCKREYNLKWHRKERGSEWTYDEYELAMDKQEGKCAICDKPPEEGKRLHGDHDHKTGKSRELLCIHCNMALGVFNDDVHLVKRAAEYLQKHNAQ